MNDQFDIRRICFLIIYSLVIALSRADSISETFQYSGWTKSKDSEINSVSGTFLAQSYIKKVGEANAKIVYIPSKNMFYGDKSLPFKYEQPLFFFDDEIHTINWMPGYQLTIGGINFSAKDEKETSVALQSFETMFSRNTKELYKIRRYKGAFGPYDVGGQVLQSVRFSGTNLFLTFLYGGQEATLELSSGFEYVGSTIGNGRKIDPVAVVTTPMRSLADIHRKIEEGGAKIMAAEHEANAKSAERNTTNDKNLSSTTNSTILNGSEIAKELPNPIIQETKLNTLESSINKKVDHIEVTSSSHKPWIITASILVFLLLIYTFFKKRQ
jgi:hypothetical protein